MRSVKDLSIIYNQCFFFFQIIVKKSEKSGFFFVDFCKKEGIIIVATEGMNLIMNGALYTYKIPCSTNFL